MPDIELNNKILILLRQPKGKSAGNTLDYRKLLWTETHHKDYPSQRAQCQRHVTPLESDLPGRQESGQTENPGKGEDTNQLTYKH